MNLKNYTSEVPAYLTIGTIERLLIEAGVQSITKEYGPESAMVALQFGVPRPDGRGTIAVRLPADVDAVHQSLWLDYVGKDQLNADGQTLWFNRRKTKTKKDFKPQAERTAWKLMQDWVQVQLSLIKLQKVDALQVFLPYVWDGTQTYYSALKGKGFLQLTQ